MKFLYAGEFYFYNLFIFYIYFLFIRVSTMTKGTTFYLSENFDIHY